nr:putative transmembrane protein [uncultured bacterium]
MLAQIAQSVLAQYESYDDEYSLPMWFWLYAGAAPFVGLIGTAFWIWMIVDCARKDPDRNTWLWILVFVPFSSPIYFILRWIPISGVRAPAAFKRMSRGREIDRLEIATQQIGNAHQFVQYGDALRDVGKIDRSASAYASALKKDPENRQALWGAGQSEFDLKRFDSARGHLEKLLAIDPQYKFGDVSLCYGKTLFELNERDAADTHLEKHINRWRHPEALFVRATIAADRGDASSARSHLQSLLLDINGAPRAIARRHMIWKSRAKKLLKRLPANGRDASMR